MHIDACCARYGHLTWEWKKGIRSYLHPMVFALLYKILAVLGLDAPLVMVNYSFHFSCYGQVIMFLFA